MDGNVRLDKNGTVAELVLDRPAKHNALTPHMYDQIKQACEQINADADIHVCIVRGEGPKAFCAGSDIKALENYANFWEWRNRNDYIASLRSVRKPLIAAVKGWALGGGLEIALACDVRVVSPNAVFSAPEITMGWNGAGGAAQHLTRMAGYGQAMRYLLTGERFGFAVAEKMNMVQWEAPEGGELELARQIAQQIAAHSTVASQAVKAAVRSAMNTSVDMGLQIENELMSLCFAKIDLDKQTAINATSRLDMGKDGANG
ncbi:MAG: enoyl-CoA hydratase/isomerase family protein [Asticcacaulis sp.]